MGQGAHRQPAAKCRAKPPGRERPAQTNSDHELKVARTTLWGLPVEYGRSRRPAPGLIGERGPAVTEHRSQQGPRNNLKITEGPYPKLLETIDD